MLDNHSLDGGGHAAKLRAEAIKAAARYHAEAHRPRPFVPGKTVVPVSGKIFDHDEMEHLISASLDFWLTSGRFDSAFCRALEEFLSVKFVLTANSGSSANLLAVSALRSGHLGERALQDGDEVITAAAGFPTTVNPILQNNLVPVFVDVNPGTYAPDVEQLRRAVSEKTKAVIFAHTLGNPFEAGKVRKICDDAGMYMIEDCCDALGSEHASRRAGGFGDMSTFSFYPAHQITTGEGGAVATSDPVLKRAVESLRDWGRDCFCAPGVNNTCGKRFGWQLGQLPRGYDHKYTYSSLGYNLKMTDMQAAVGLAQMSKLDGFVEARRRNFEFLRGRLARLDRQLVLPSATPGSNPSWFGFPVTTGARDELAAFLKSRLIDTRPVFAGNITKQPYFAGRRYRTAGTLDNTDAIMRGSLWVGVFPGLDEQMLEYVAAAFDDFFGR